MDSSTRVVKKIPKTSGNKRLNESSTTTELDVSQVEQDSSNLSEQEVLKAFRFFDKNKKGYLTCREYVNILLGFTDKFNFKDVEDILKESNLDISGNIDYKKFYDLWKN